MRSIALLPSIAILAGVYAGTARAGTVASAPALLVCIWLAASCAWRCRAPAAAIGIAIAGYAVAGFTLGAGAAERAFAPSIRTALDAVYGGFALDTLGPPGPHGPVLLRARLVDDAAVREFGVVLDANAEALALEGEWRRVEGGVRLTVSGAVVPDRAARWRAGRLIEAPVTFRRPTRYLNDGVADFERELALAGVALHGSVKSGLLVEAIAAGGRLAELAADVRGRVRSAVKRWIAAHDPVAGAIVTAILIGDRTALPGDVRERLRAAGTYHVMAISGGNIAILAALMAALLLPVASTGRASALTIICGLAAYAFIVSAGPSVVRATVMAIAYLAARLLDHRSPPWNAMAVSAALVACATPADVRDVGFVLTFGATAAILEAARRVHVRGAPMSWIAASLAASAAAELVLLPINAAVFSRATAAGLALNLLAVPLMTVAQTAGLAVVIFDRVDAVAGAAGAIAAHAAGGLVKSAQLVDLLPWLALRVPPPSLLLVAAYYLALAGALWLRRGRAAATVLLVACGAAVLLGVPAPMRPEDLGSHVRLTMLDVGQGDAVLLQMPGGRAVMVDSGGAGADGAGFDIGGRVLAPALWARGIRRLDALAITHADPDHIGGAVALVRDFGPAEIWQGIEMPHHPPSRALLAAGLASGAVVQRRLAGWSAMEDGVTLRVLHPPPPDWERPRVRNDDSLVIEVRFGDVAILLTGDIGADVERSLIPMLTPARVRILKVAHHGSRTSTSQALIDAWQPQIALISCGRGNRFGHPAAEVVRRLENAGARIYRTDRDGQITVDTDGQTVSVRTASR